MNIKYSNAKEVKCYRDFVLNPSDRKVLRVFSKIFGAPLMEFAKKLHDRLINYPYYDEERLLRWLNVREWLDYIEDVEYFKSLPRKLADCGVDLVLVPFLPKTVYGAIRWIDNKPLIQISDRGRDIVSCWFTLFHEFGHAIKHKDMEIYEGSINDTKAYQERREREANKFANEYLFNGDNLRKAVFERKRKGVMMSAKELAEEFNVLPIFAS